MNVHSNRLVLTKVKPELQLPKMPNLSLPTNELAETTASRCPADVPRRNMDKHRYLMSVRRFHHQTLTSLKNGFEREVACVGPRYQ